MAEDNTTSDELHCAGCGVKEDDDIKLKKCEAVLIFLITALWKMRGVEGTDGKMLCCAGCGITGGDDIKLKKCNGCHLVRYCGVKCQKEHRPKHKKECKKRAAELRDEILFKQPEGNHLGDCPICFVPMPIDREKSSTYLCCCKSICDGCNIANVKREMKGNIDHKCPFCRRDRSETEEEINEQWMKRVEANKIQL